MIYNNDCLEVLTGLRKNSIDFIITSPPYADKRGAVKSENYSEWFLPVSEQLLRVLKPDGSFILIIKEGAKNGERSTYVLELILALKKQGWYWIEEYIWHKKNSFPGKWHNRFRDAWERCLHFSKNKHFRMYQDNVMVPASDATNKRLSRIIESDLSRHYNQTNSGMSVNRSNWKQRNQVYPTNVIHMAIECKNKQHSAAFPIHLPLWFIQLFTKKNDLVLDPFIGSGTTGQACIKLNRKYLGIEIDKNNYELAIENTQIMPTIKNNI